jgi:flagellar motor switch/type III secretory pathway protein FliN
MSDQVEFAPLQDSANGEAAGSGDLERLYDVTVELPVNGRPIARGEVVVIDEEFGLRITEVTTPRSRPS